ncbi:seipin isoform X2 [Eurytemora carolleeae]|uniref:seipin isoform X2 n=1 Tax=Eurytemora carolleeae TaxID=1294199 RepID=UPI000C77E51C|nr:seipin isoform X2 [Eurytemora carolleeae]|eukprot:XP_023320273.1 seipin-like isoform X2 [Eurytemora affinis]
MILAKILMFHLTMMMLLLLSIISYSVFFQAYSPHHKYSKEMNLMFQSCPETPGVCSFPNASLDMDAEKIELNRGLKYKVSVDIVLPKYQDDAMFLLCFRARTRADKLKTITCKSSLLLGSEFWHPENIFNFWESRELVNRKSIMLTESFSEEYSDPIKELSVEFQSKFLMIHSVEIEIESQLNGFGYIQSSYPFIFGLAGVTSNVLFLSVVFLVSFSSIILPKKVD